MNDVGHRIRAACTICGHSHLARVAKERVSPDPSVRAEAVGADAEDWQDTPSRLRFDARCPDCESTTLHKLPEHSSFPGGFAVPTIHERADELR